MKEIPEKKIELYDDTNHHSSEKIRNGINKQINEKKLSFVRITFLVGFILPSFLDKINKRIFPYVFLLNILKYLSYHHNTKCFL